MMAKAGKKVLVLEQVRVGEVIEGVLGNGRSVRLNLTYITTFTLDISPIALFTASLIAARPDRGLSPLLPREEL